MTRIRFTLAVAVALLLGKGVQAQDAGPNEVAARTFLGLLEKGEFAAACKDFDETMTKAMPPEKLAEVWKTLNNQAKRHKVFAGWVNMHRLRRSATP